jgi:hypothetical protein
MALRKYGTSTDQQVTEVEQTGGAEEISKTASAQQWTSDDERGLLDESEE